MSTALTEQQTDKIKEFWQSVISLARDGDSCMDSNDYGSALEYLDDIRDDLKKIEKELEAAQLD